MRILYVEDNPANLFLVQRVARMGNHEVINYTEGQKALDNFTQDRPDLILMDIQLPGKLTGLDVVKALRDAGHKTPIIAVTAYAMIGDRERCLQVGCNAYIAKPLPVGELVDMIREYENRMAGAAAAAPATSPAPEKQAEQPKSETPAASPVPSSAAQAVPPVRPETPAVPSAPAKAETPAPAAPPVVSPAKADTPAEKQPDADSVPPVVEEKAAAGINVSVESTKPEKPADLESVLSSSQNSSTTLSSTHQ